MSRHLQSLAVSDTGFVFDPQTGHTYAVNATGLAVLRGLKSGRSVEQIEDELKHEFEQALGVSEHVREFVQLLLELGLTTKSEVAS